MLKMDGWRTRLNLINLCKSVTDTRSSTFILTPEHTPDLFHVFAYFTTLQYTLNYPIASFCTRNTLKKYVKFAFHRICWSLQTFSRGSVSKLNWFSWDCLFERSWFSWDYLFYRSLFSWDFLFETSWFSWDCLYIEVDSRETVSLRGTYYRETVFYEKLLLVTVRLTF